MKVLTAAEMREVDRKTEELGIPGPILMENAGHRVMEYIAERWPLLSRHRIVVLCGKGNNGGDGFVVARQLFTRYRVGSLHVATIDPDQDSAALRMLRAAGCPVYDEITEEMRSATLVVDALLGTGLNGPARGKPLEWITAINTQFPFAQVIAVDVPSGMQSDSGTSEGEVARANVCVTFTAPKICHALAPNCDLGGHLVVGRIGSPDQLMQDVRRHMTDPGDFSAVLRPRDRDSNKGDFGHVLIVGGAEGKTGAPQMTGLAALRVGAGLATLASSAAGFNVPELMSEPLPESWEALEKLSHRKRVIAIGPGLGYSEATVAMVRAAVVSAKQAMVLDADALGALDGFEWNAGDHFRVLTPHPGEMSRLTGKSIAEVQADRVVIATNYATVHGAVVVLKGYRTVIAFPDGRIWVNPTGSPALAKGGTGDVLTGMIAGMVAQFPEQREPAVLAAVYLHGSAGDLAARARHERTVLATEILDHFGEALRESSRFSDRL